MKPNQYGRYFEEFSEGAVLKHDLSKTITESDNNLFCLLTMNHHPVHLDVIYASDQVHGKILVVGTLVFSLVVGLTVSDLSGRAIANLDYREIKHLAPVFIGDTITVESTILEKRYSTKNRNRGIIKVQTVARNQKNQDVISFQRNILVLAKEGLNA